MKLMKMLGLASVAAAALMMIAGSGTASASGRLCSTATNPCNSPWAVNTALDWSLRSGTSLKWTDTSGNTLNTCTLATIKGTLISNAPSPSTPVVQLTQILLGSAGTPCTVTTDAVVTGGFKFAAGSSGAGTVSASSKIEVTVNVFSSCNFGFETGTTLGTVTEGTGTSSVINLNAVAKKLNGGFLCPETQKWTGELVLTTPSNTTAYWSTS
jgi:hypothetical protein